MSKPPSATARTSTSRRDAVCVLPPYGEINAENASFLGRRPVPAGFRAQPNSKLPSAAEPWEQWLSSTAEHMSDFLWPIYRDGAWVGKSAQHATALTLLDLEMVRSLQHRFHERIAGQDGTFTARQSEAFQKEDEGAPGSTFLFYKSGLPTYLESELNRAILVGGLEIARPASQGLKRIFQRPRPQQTAMLLGVKGIVVQLSKSAITPAMISGHCIQGSLAFAQVLASMSDVPAALLDAVGRFLIETGDRRVYAGLHYPTDNIGSWYVALRLCPHVFGDKAEAVRTGLWQAISKHSAVHAALIKSLESPFKPLRTSAALYAPMLEELEKAAKGEDA